MKREFTATSDEVEQFARVTGDDNAIHVDADAASESIFGERVIHGVLALGWISSMLNDYGDGTTILLGFEQVSFSNAIYLDETVEITLDEERDGKIEFAASNSEPKFHGYAIVTIK